MRKILEAGHSLELVITQPDRPSGRGKKLSPSPVKKLAYELGIAVCQPQKIRNDPAVLEKLKNIQPDLIVVVAYGQIIPASIIYLPKHNSWNVHFSLLPKYRGASPVQWAILNGEEKTGITVFELNEKMDEGGILAQQEVEILPGENSGELEARLAELGAELLVRMMARIDTIRPRPQDHSKATYTPKIKKEDGLIDWKKDSLFIERQLRAFTPWPSAYTFFQGMRIKLLKGKSKEERTSASSTPGEILTVYKEGIEVRCGERSLFLIQSLQPEGKPQMAAHAFSLGSGLKAGRKFGLF